MMIPDAFHKLGQFMVYFQHLEHTINELLVLMAGADEENVCILIHELEYSKRLKTTDVLFARFVDLRSNTDPAIKNRKAQKHSYAEISDILILSNKKPRITGVFC
ncbi:MAG: hypothetical protein KBA82_12500 [Nitrosomonas sp.]|jgi:hypothetical protein|nr:hypothetical protein [Nitrosomonas sp.]MBP7113748.1 hypothetical protein [Nitrosomonas sp.]